MPRRVNLPGADELFRAQATAEQVTAGPGASSPARPAPSGPTGRVRHDEKITVYVSTAELVNLEQARLRLRADFGINVDRGRLVREAIDMLVEDLAAGGADSAVAQRLLE